MWHTLKAGTQHVKYLLHVESQTAGSLPVSQTMALLLLHLLPTVGKSECGSLKTMLEMKAAALVYFMLHKTQ